MSYVFLNIPHELVKKLIVNALLLSLGMALMFLLQIPIKVIL